MSDPDELADIDIPGIEEYPATESVKLHGPPGTGKTTTSAARVGLLLDQHGYKLRDVTWCTYRTALAEETLQKFAEWDLVSEATLEHRREGAAQYIATAHAIGYRLMPDMPEPVEPWQKADFCSMQDIRYWSSEPWDTTRGQLLFDVMYWLKKNCYDPADPTDVSAAPMYPELTEEWPGVSVPDQWQKWEDYKAEQQVIDYFEMLERPLEEGVAPETAIFVADEYHDAYPLLAEVVSMWMQHSEVVIVAGDPNQVVNNFDGASPAFFEHVDLPTVLLDRSCRVAENHMAAAESLLSNAHSPPPVEPDDSGGDLHEYRSPQFWYSREDGWDVPSASSDASPAALVDEYGEDMMFLARTQQQVAGIGAALGCAGIIYQSQSDLDGWNTESAETRLAIYNALQKMEGVAPTDFGHHGGAITDYSGGDSATTSTRRQLAPVEAAELLRVTKAKYLDESRVDTDDAADDLEEKNECLTLEALDEFVTPEFWRVYTQGAGSVSSLNKTGGQQKLDDAEKRALTAAIDRYDSTVDPDNIETKALTIHASKGQEAEDVVVYDGITRTIQQEIRQREDAENNEWRTWYVGVTRASERLHIMRGAFEWTMPFLPDGLLAAVREFDREEGVSA
jgi:DNA helicase-2/ATP-dependent DNA helicase PcrA